MNYQRKAKKFWGDRIEWITGNGRFALLAHCRCLTITLWTTRKKAINSKKIIDETACGGACVGNHNIVDLDTL